MEPSFTTAKKGYMTPKGHVATKCQGEDSKEALLTPLDDFSDALVMSTGCEARRSKMETQHS